MPDPSELLLLDFFHLALLMLGFGLIAYTLIRHGNPLIRWHEHGNVWTDPFSKIDLLVVGIIIGFFYWATLYRVQNAPPPPPTNTDLAGGVMMQLFITGGLVFLLTYVRGADVGELFGLTRLSPRRIFNWSILLMLAVTPLVLLVAWGWGSLLYYALDEEPASQELVKTFREGAANTKILIAISACIVAPICEEILFRGFFYPVVKRFSERFFAAITVSLVFALVHGNALGILPLAVFAMTLTVAYELTGCLIVPIVMHAIFNSITIVRMLAGG